MPAAPAAGGWLNLPAAALSREMVAEFCCKLTSWLVLWSALPSRDAQTFGKAAVREDTALLGEESAVHKS